MTYTDVIAALEESADEKYKAFTVRLLRTGKKVYGVRTPVLRALSKRIKREFPDYAEEFFARKEVSHEEILLAGWMTGKSYEDNIRLLKKVIARADSWAQTDQTIGTFPWAKDKAALSRDLSDWTTGGEFEKRAFIVMLMTNCMREEDFAVIERYLPAIGFGEYYVDMAAAWLIAEAVIKLPERGSALLSAPFLTPSVISKARRKLRESLRT